MTPAVNHSRAGRRPRTEWLLLVAFSLVDHRTREKFPLPERLGRRPLWSHRRGGAAALQERVEVRASHAYAPTDAQRRQ